jgi:hypothetical protein
LTALKDPRLAPLKLHVKYFRRCHGDKSRRTTRDAGRDISDIGVGQFDDHAEDASEIETGDVNDGG